MYVSYLTIFEIFVKIESMRLIVQRVKKAEVKVKGKTAGKIGKGLFVLLGVKEGDTASNAEFLAEKLAKLRVMSDKSDKINLSVMDLTAQAGTHASILVVSQFTLYADTMAGNRPSFIKAAKPDEAKKLYELFIEKLCEHRIEVQTGKFGEYMEINAELDGPVTIIVDSRE